MPVVLVCVVLTNRCVEGQLQEELRLVTKELDKWALRSHLLCLAKLQHMTSQLSKVQRCGA